jgi:hypothetical protein
MIIGNTIHILSFYGLVSISFSKNNYWMMGSKEIDRMARKHFCDLTSILSNSVPVLTLKYLPVYLQRHLLALRIYTFDLESKGLTTYSPRHNSSK